MCVVVVRSVLTVSCEQAEMNSSAADAKSMPNTTVRLTIVLSFIYNSSRAATDYTDSPTLSATAPAGLLPEAIVVVCGRAGDSCNDDARTKRRWGRAGSAPDLHTPPTRAALLPVPLAPYPRIAALEPLPRYPGRHALRGFLPAPIDPDPFVVPPGPVTRDPCMPWRGRGEASLLTRRRGRLPYDSDCRSRYRLPDNHLLLGYGGITLRYNIMSWCRCRCRCYVGRGKQKHRQDYECPGDFSVLHHRFSFSKHGKRLRQPEAFLCVKGRPMFYANKAVSYCFSTSVRAKCMPDK